MERRYSALYSLSFTILEWRDSFKVLTVFQMEKDQSCLSDIFLKTPHHFGERSFVDSFLPTANESGILQQIVCNCIKKVSQENVKIWKYSGKNISRYVLGYFSLTAFRKLVCAFSAEPSTKAEPFRIVLSVGLVPSYLSEQLNFDMVMKQFQFTSWYGN